MTINKIILALRSLNSANIQITTLQAAELLSATMTMLTDLALRHDFSPARREAHTELYKHYIKYIDILLGSEDEMTLKYLKENILAYIKDIEAERFMRSLEKQGFEKIQKSPTLSVYRHTPTKTMVSFVQSRLRPEYSVELIPWQDL